MSIRSSARLYEVRETKCGSSYSPRLETKFGIPDVADVGLGTQTAARQAAACTAREVTLGFLRARGKKQASLLAASGKERPQTASTTVTNQADRRTVGKPAG